MVCLAGLPLPSLLVLFVCYASGKEMLDDDYDDYDDEYYHTGMSHKGGPPQYRPNYHDPPNPPPVPTYDQSINLRTIPCYTCHFIFQYNHQQGPSNCKDPFSSFDIPTIPCRGACAKIYRKLEGKNEFDLSRNCMPNCKEFRTEKESIECCTTELCNGAVAAANIKGCRTVSTLIIALLFLILILRW